jgi:hypothetical protein
MPKIRLFRGLKTPDFRLFSAAEGGRQRRIWKRLLEARARGDFSHPAAMDEELQWLEKSLRLGRQFFTDCKDIASAYAKTTGGALVSLEVPLAEVLKLFALEFQNFGSRKKKLELVYVVSGSVLAKRAKAWRLKLTLTRKQKVVGIKSAAARSRPKNTSRR